MLQENIITCVLEKENMDWGSEISRNAVSKAFKITSEKMENWDCNNEKDENSLIRNLLKNEMVVALSSDFEKLRFLRNDLNHGGYLTDVNRQAKSSLSILDKFEKIYSEIKNYLK